MVKNMLTMWETWVQSLGWEDPLEGMATHFSILAWKIPRDRGAWQATVHGLAESDSTKRLSTKYLPGPPEPDKQGGQGLGLQLRLVRTERAIRVDVRAGGRLWDSPLAAQA